MSATVAARPAGAAGAPGPGDRDRADERRRAWRRRLVRAGLLLVLLAVLLVAKVATMVVMSERGRDAYTDGDHAEARRAFGVNAVLNWFEPWVAPYDEGTAAFRLGAFDDAVRLLEEALETVPAERECLVRTNLALSYEARGDALLAGGARPEARVQWTLGLRALRDGGCEPDPDRLGELVNLLALVSRGADGRKADAADAGDLAELVTAFGSLGGDAATAASTTAVRIIDKLRDSAVEPPDVEPQTPEEQKADELEKRNQNAQDKAEQNDQVREDEKPPPDEPDQPVDPDDPDEPDDPQPNDEPTYNW